ncbi:MAG: HAMP domain-containing protein [Deltaproteobacteria bacterium]|nr:HAMP domain-containing protein [Deltaproteobacteria bacterium]
MKRLKIRGLRQRIVFFLLLPLTLLLFGLGFFGFIFARNMILNEWKKASVLELERAGHQIDMRLGEPLLWIERFNDTGTRRNSGMIQEWILKQLRQLEGVTRADLEWKDASSQSSRMPMGASMMGRGGAGQFHQFHRARISEVTPPQHDMETGEQVVVFTSHFKDETGRNIGKLEVAIKFDYLLHEIRSLGWWQSDFAGLVDKNGRYLAHTEDKGQTHSSLGESKDPLDLAMLEAIKERHFGTLIGPGVPPEKVGGFYRLKNAPWTIVLFADGKKVLAPVIRFRFYYFIIGITSILCIVLLVRYLIGRPVRNIIEISEAAREVADGKYVEPLAVKSADEIGQLTESFNVMVKGLKERDFIRNTFGRYIDEEIAKELLKRPEASRLGGEKREVAILMSDLRDFTQLSESLTPEDTIRIVNSYFSHMIDVIRQYKGIIVDFFGDSVLSFFDPLDEPVDLATRQAVYCAFEMQERLNLWNSRSKAERLPELQMGVGVNTGEVVVGNIGSDTRAKYGIVGSPVNVTQRIQSFAKKGEVVLSEPAYNYAKDEIRIKKTLDTRLKGIRDAVKLYVVERNHE